MTVRIPFLVACGLLYSLSVASDESQIIDAREHLASLYDSTIRNAILSRMADTGLSQVDIDATADIALSEYAGCTIDALGKMDNPAATAFLSSLNQGESAEDLDSRLREVGDEYFADFFLELNALTEPCRLDVDSRLGIPPGK